MFCITDEEDKWERERAGEQLQKLLLLILFFRKKPGDQ
jgi:hypothetical protein